MRKGFLSILKKSGSQDPLILEKFRAEFPSSVFLEKNGGSAFWFSNQIGIETKYVMENPIDSGRIEAEYPRSVIRFDAERFSVHVESDALALATVYEGTFHGLVVLSDSIDKILEVARICGYDPAPDWNAVIGTLSYGITPVGKTFVQRVRWLEGGSRRTYGFSPLGGRPVILDFQTSAPLDFSKMEVSGAEFGERYAGAFEWAIDRIVETTEGKPVGVLFSGGLDSSMVLNALVKRGKRERGGIVPVTAINEGTEFTDENYAKKVLAELGLSRLEIPMNEEDFGLFHEAVSDLEDASESGWLGMLLKKIFREGKKRGIETFVSGSGTDAPIGGSIQIMATLWTAYFKNGVIEWNLFDMKRFEWTPDSLSGLLEFTKRREPKIGEASYFGEIEKNLRWLLELVPVPGITKTAFVPDWIRGYAKGDNLSYRDFLILTDLTTHSHRFSTIYSKMAKSEGVSHVTPFGSDRTRGLLYRAPTEYVFNPVKNPITTWDNQFFYKSALRSFIPSSLSGRTKGNGSFADKTLWLFSPKFFPAIRGKIDSGLRQMSLDPSFSEKTLSGFDKIFEAAQIIRASPDPSDLLRFGLKTQSFLVFLWRILSIAETLENLSLTQVRNPH